MLEAIGTYIAVIAVAVVMLLGGCVIWFLIAMEADRDNSSTRNI